MSHDGTTRVRTGTDGEAPERRGAVEPGAVPDPPSTPLPGPGAREGSPSVPNPGAAAPSGSAPEPGAAPEPGPAPGGVLPDDGRLVDRIAGSAEPFGDLERLELEPLLERIGDARLVLLGEASHGTSEFYRVRERITLELLEKKGFDFVAVEADWPDAAEIDAYVRHHPAERPRREPFQRFPRWMWANTDVLDFVLRLRDRNRRARDGDPGRMVGFHGLDLYSMHDSIDAVLGYLRDVDPEAEAVARSRYDCLMPWQDEPVQYGRAAVAGTIEACEDEIVAMLGDLHRRRLDDARRDRGRFLDAVQNARLVANAERYYRFMYRGPAASWNLRDRHMFDTLRGLLDHYGPRSKAVVWAHNSHVGDASATEMAARGEHNLGQLAREAFGSGAYLVGFGTHSGTVAAASEWGGAMDVREVRPSHPRSYEHLAHASGIERFFLPLRTGRDPGLRAELAERRLERAIGVIYRPETEMQSHYLSASLSHQFDEWIWLERTRAVTPLPPADRTGAKEPGEADTFPFGV